ncbi:MAG TPA: carboxypeptidase-like regulatory domain-containing protein [Candidatus Tyrphobacter sp.]
MKKIGTLLALASLLAAPAIAAQWGGLSGRVTDLQTGQPIANANILLYRASNNWNGPYHLMRLTTNARGFFVKMPLEPGRYVVMARVPGRMEGCAIDDILSSENVRVSIKVGYKTLTCSGPRVHPAIVNPNGGGDLYII